jgi:hypothetical protein
MPGGPRISIPWSAASRASSAGSAVALALTAATNRSKPAGELVTSQRAPASPTR